MNRIAISFTGLICLVCATALHAATAFSIVVPNPGPTATGNDGFMFQPNSDILVTSLGYYDHLRDGFAFAHSVGIFAVSNRLLLASATITSSNSLIGDFRFASISPVLLRGCHLYILGGYATFSSVDQIDFGSFTVNTALVYHAYCNNYEPGFSFPNIMGGRPAFGPNMEFTLPDTPRPPQLSVPVHVEGGYSIHVLGTPDVTYLLQRSPSVTGPWFDISTNAAPPSGFIEFYDASPPPGRALYRSVQP